MAGPEVEAQSRPVSRNVRSLQEKGSSNMTTLESSDRLGKRREPVLPDNLDSDRVVSDEVVAAILNISLMTLIRMRARGEGPPRRQISPRRFGTRLRDIQAFLDRVAV
jgi:hypothetical protein